MKLSNTLAQVEEPLVSIIVITYNSSLFVLETLDSIKNQSYSSIELIISDDCSTDNTVEKCLTWLEKEKERFIKCHVLQTPKNTGIPANANRGNNEATGKWIKLIAGDDILLPECIQYNMEFVSRIKSPFVFSVPIYINERSENVEQIEDHKTFKKNDRFYQLSARQQFLYLLTQNIPMNPPTLFYRKNALENLGGFDENYKNEDFPLYLKATHAGYKLDFFYKETVKYRIHDSSYSIKVKNENAISYWEIIKLEKHIKHYINWNLFWNSPLVVMDYYNRLFFAKIILRLGNTQTVKNYLLFIRYLSPLILINKIKSFHIQDL